jgi:hypothetical protein
MTDIIKMFKENRPELSLLSIKTYASSIVKVLELLKSNNISSLYTNSNKVIKVINDNYVSPNSKKTKFASIIVFLKMFIDAHKPNDKSLNEQFKKAIEKYTEEIDKCSKEIKDTLSTNEKTDKEDKNWLTPEDVEQVKENLKNNVPKKINTIYDLNKFRDYIIFMLYEDIPSRADLANAKIIFKSKKPLSDEYNYIVLDKKNNTSEYHLNQYKTKNTYGSKIIKINDDLYKLLSDYKKEVDKFNDSNYFLLNDYGSQITPNRLSVIYSHLADSINKKISLSLNRKMKISTLYNIPEMKELANKMGHSINEALSVYAKE